MSLDSPRELMQLLRDTVFLMPPEICVVLDGIICTVKLPSSKVKIQKYIIRVPYIYTKSGFFPVKTYKLVVFD